MTNIDKNSDFIELSSLDGELISRVPKIRRVPKGKPNSPRGISFYKNNKSYKITSISIKINGKEFLTKDYIGRLELPKIREIDKLTSLFTSIEKYLQKVAPKTWSKTNDSFLDTIDTIPDEIERWEERNLKYVAYLVIAWDLLGYCRYFLKTLISNAIATKRVSS